MKGPRKEFGIQKGSSSLLDISSNFLVELT